MAGQLAPLTAVTCLFDRKDMPMGQEVTGFRISGAQSEVETLARELSSQIEGLEISICRPESKQATSFLQRDPLRHVEAWELLVGFGLNILASAAYDEIKKRVKSMAQKRQLKTEEVRSIPSVAQSRDDKSKG